MVETFSFGGKAPSQQAGVPELTDLPSPERPFTLADSMAIATYADFLPGETRFHWTPTYEYWPIGKGKEEARLFQIGDGGFIEDTGLLAMLQRGVQKAAVFLFGGPGQQLSMTVDFCGLSSQVKAGHYDPKNFEASGKITDSIHVMFGYGYDDGMWHKLHNTVFKQAEMFDLACGLQKLKKAGRPLIYRSRLEVQRNEYWGIRGGWTVEVVWYYNDIVREFEDLLPSDTKHELGRSLKGFPNDLPAGLWMTPRVIQLMAAQAEYSVLRNANLYRELLGK